MTVVLQPWPVCKNVLLCGQRQQRRSHLNTACPWQVLSAFLLLLLLLPSPQLRPSSPNLSPSSSLSFLLLHYTYSPRNMCTYIARHVGFTMCSRLLNCRLRPSFCTLARNGLLRRSTPRNPGFFHWNGERMKWTWILRRDHICHGKSNDRIKQDLKYLISHDSPV